MQEILCSDPAVDCARFDAYALYRIDERYGFYSVGEYRERGFFVGMNISVGHDHGIWRSAYESRQAVYAGNELLLSAETSHSNRTPLCRLGRGGIPSARFCAAAV